MIHDAGMCIRNKCIFTFTLPLDLWGNWLNFYCFSCLNVMTKSLSLSVLFIYLSFYNVNLCTILRNCRLLNSLRGILVLTHLSWQAIQYMWIFNIWRYCGCHTKVVGSGFNNWVFVIFFSSFLLLVFIVPCVLLKPLFVC